MLPIYTAILCGNTISPASVVHDLYMYAFCRESTRILCYVLKGITHDLSSNFVKIIFSFLMSKMINMVFFNALSKFENQIPSYNRVTEVRNLCFDTLNLFILFAISYFAKEWQFPYFMLFVNKYMT